jgi:Pyrimidine dimer DNA glycosylase
MQTFLPYPSKRESLDALDNKRLNKQILETYQILNILTGNSKSGAWRNHPAVLMWVGAESELYRYGMTAIVLAEMRGIKTDKNRENMDRLVKSRNSLNWEDGTPKWAKSPSVIKRVNATHKANLYRKDPIYYAEFASSVTDPNNKPCCDKCLYYWVTHTER